MLYLSNLSSYEKLDDATFGRVVKAVMRTKNTGEATDLTELEQFVYDNLLAQVEEDEKRYLKGLEFDRERKNARRDAENVDMNTSTTQEEKVAQKPNKCEIEGVSDDVSVQSTEQGKNCMEFEGNESSRTLCDLNDNEWHNFYEDCKSIMCVKGSKVLKPFEEISEELQREKYALSTIYGISTDEIEDYINQQVRNVINK